MPLIAAVAALTVTTAPPALAEPAQDRPYSQLVPLADLGPAFDPAAPEMSPGLYVTPSDTLYVADPTTATVSTVSADGTVTPVPGTWLQPGETMDIMTEPRSVTVGDDGTVYVLTIGSVRKVTPDGTGAVIADDTRPNTENSVLRMQDLAIDSAGNLYAAKPNDGVIKRIDPSGVVSTIAGGGDVLGKEAEGVPATEAFLSDPAAVDVDATGNVYLMDAKGIRKVGPDGKISMVTKEATARSPMAGIQTDGLDVQPDGSGYFSCEENAFVCRFDREGKVTTLGPLPGGDIAVGKNGDIYRGVDGKITALRKKTTIDTKPVAAGPEPRWTANREPGAVLPVKQGATELADVRAVTVQPSGALVLVVGTDVVQLGADGTTKAVPGYPDGLFDGPLAFGRDGSMYLGTATADLERLFPNGIRQPLLGSGDLDGKLKDGAVGPLTTGPVSGAAVTTDGSLYFIAGKALYRLTDDGTVSTAATFDPADFVGDLTAGPDNSLYLLVDRRVVRVDEQHQVTTVAGDGTVDFDDIGDGGPADEAPLNNVRALAVSRAGNIYVGTDEGVRRVDPDGYIGTLPTVRDDIEALAVDQRGNLYLTTFNDNRLKVVVHADDVELPHSFPWSTVLWGALVLVVLAAGGAWVLRRRANRTKPTVHSGEDDE